MTRGTDRERVLPVLQTADLTSWLGRIMSACLALLGPCLLIVAASAQQPTVAGSSTPSLPSPSPPKPVPQLAYLYKISADDLLDVYVVDVPEYSRSYRVAPDGTIRLPLLREPIMAAGQTPAALGNIISAQLTQSQLLNDPRVLVEVKESRSHAIAITGAVKLPQNYQLFGRTSVLNILSQAGGLTDDASNKAIVTRGDISTWLLAPLPGAESPSQNSPVTAGTISVDLKRLMQGVQSENLELYPGDSVVVQPAGIVYVVGAVNRAGGFVMNGDRDSMTVLKAVALAENLKNTASSKNAVIIRKNPASPNGTEQIPVDLSKVLSNHAADTRMIASDILFIPDSTGKKVFYAVSAAVLQTATLAIYHVP
jgi:polysaccharide export outer membrane protein